MVCMPSHYTAGAEEGGFVQERIDYKSEFVLKEPTYGITVVFKEGAVRPIVLIADKSGPERVQQCECTLNTDISIAPSSVLAHNESCALGWDPTGCVLVAQRNHLCWEVNPHFAAKIRNVLPPTRLLEFVCDGHTHHLNTTGSDIEHLGDGFSIAELDYNPKDPKCTRKIRVLVVEGNKHNPTWVYRCKQLEPKHCCKLYETGVSGVSIEFHGVHQQDALMVAGMKLITTQRAAVSKKTEVMHYGSIVVFKIPNGRSYWTVCCQDNELEQFHPNKD